MQPAISPDVGIASQHSALTVQHANLVLFHHRIHLAQPRLHARTFLERHEPGETLVPADSACLADFGVIILDRPLILFLCSLFIVCVPLGALLEFNLIIADHPIVHLVIIVRLGLFILVERAAELDLGGVFGFPFDTLVNRIVERVILGERRSRSYRQGWLAPGS